MKTNYSVPAPTSAVVNIPTIFITKLFLILAFLTICSVKIFAGVSPVSSSLIVPVNNTLNIETLKVNASNSALVISWQADVNAFEHYIVEKSLDGENFKAIGIVLDVMETTNTCLFKDQKLANTGVQVWYRVKGVAKTGTQTCGQVTVFNK